MSAKIICIVSILCFSLCAIAGEKQQLYLTGNRSVDFFGSSKLSMALSDTDRSVLDVSLMQTSEESEKSPWIAGLLSLAVPGAGEVYSKSYVKGGIFFGVEVASWLIAWTYNKKGDRQTDVFQDYANAHYSPVKYAYWVWMNYKANPGIDSTQYHLFPSGPNFSDIPPFPSLSWRDLNRLEEAIGGDFSHRLPVFGEQQYYELIGKYKQFSKGWDTEDINDPDHSHPKQQYFDYAVMFMQADHFYTVADRFVAVIVANHILSALDAAWSATRFNKTLHAEAHLRMQPTPYGYIPAVQANLSYSF